MAAKRLGGWWRLWIAAAGLWAIVVGVRTAMVWPKSDPYAAAFDRDPMDKFLGYTPAEAAAAAARREALLQGFILWAIPSGGVLGLTLLARWVGRGFESKGTEA